MTLLEILTLIISAIGACAWIPKVLESLIFRRSKLSARILDLQSIRNFQTEVTNSDGKRETIEGILVILMLEFRYLGSSQVTFPFWKCKIRIALQDDHQLLDAVIVNRVDFFNSSKTGNPQELVPMRFDFPSRYNIHVNSNIININSLPALKGAVESDQNVRIIPCLLHRDSKLHPVQISDIDTVQIVLYNKARRGKKVTVLWDRLSLPQKGFIASFAKKRD